MSRHAGNTGCPRPNTFDSANRFAAIAAAAFFKESAALAGNFNLKLSNAVFIGDSITMDWCGEGLRMFPLPAKSFSLLAWRKDSSPAVLEFKDYLKSAYPKEC